MKKLLFLLVFSNIFFSCLKAQKVDIHVYYGTYQVGQFDYPCPFQDFYEGYREQYLYRASELRAFGMTAGKITAIKFFVQNINGQGLVEDYSIRMGTTTNNTLSFSSWEPVTTTVYGPVNYTVATLWNTLTFHTPFFWNGTDNIVVDFCNGDPDNATATTYTQNCRMYTDYLGFNCAHTYIADNLGNLCGTTNTTQTSNSDPNTRPMTIFTWENTEPCLPDTIPYQENFDNAPWGYIPVCTYRDTTNTHYWGCFSLTVPYFSSKLVGYGSITTDTANSWFFTEGIQLNANTSYRLTFRYGNYASGSNASHKMNVKYGTAPKADSMQNLLLNFPNINNYASNNAMVDFTPTATGIYYIGYHAYSNPNQGDLLLDDIKVAYTPTVPIKLSLFAGRRVAAVNELTWVTATEGNSSGFELQRSADGIHFTAIAFVPTQAVDGNSTTALRYGYIDEHPLPGITYYRLKQLDKDHRFVWSDIIKIKGDLPNGLVIASVYPNPTAALVKVIIYAPSSQQVSIVVADITGRPIIKQSINLTSGNNTTVLDMRKLSAGTYLLKVACANGCETAIVKVVRE